MIKNDIFIVNFSLNILLGKVKNNETRICFIVGFASSIFHAREETTSW